MNRANAFPLPRPKPIQSLSSMGQILTLGYVKSISAGELQYLPSGYVIPRMQTVSETRKQRLGMLKEKYARWGDLNEAIGWARTDPRLSQILSGNIRSNRGTPYVMGDTTARLIEEKLNLQPGWMDTPPSPAEMHGENDPSAMIQALLDGMSEGDKRAALRIVAALKEPDEALKNGTEH